MVLIDCGADIGFFSARMAVSCPTLNRIIAFEPNENAFEVLRENMKHLPVQGEARLAALSDFKGACELRSPQSERSEHAKFIIPAPEGIPVQTIDDLDLPAGCSPILKIDVEGAELNVLRGARSTLDRARTFVVGFEASKEVFGRTGIDPIECVRYIESVRHCEVVVAERPEIQLRHDQGLFEQVTDLEVCNVICKPLLS